MQSSGGNKYLNDSDCNRTSSLTASSGSLRWGNDSSKQEHSYPTFIKSSYAAEQVKYGGGTEDLNDSDRTGTSSLTESSTSDSLV